MIIKLEDLTMRAHVYSSQVLSRLEERHGRIDKKERKELKHQLELAYINGAKDIYNSLPRMDDNKLAA